MDASPPVCTGGISAPVELIGRLVGCGSGTTTAKAGAAGAAPGVAEPLLVPLLEAVEAAAAAALRSSSMRLVTAMPGSLFTTLHWSTKREQLTSDVYDFTGCEEGEGGCLIAKSTAVDLQDGRISVENSQASRMDCGKLTGPWNRFGATESTPRGDANGKRGWVV